MEYFPVEPGTYVVENDFSYFMGPHGYIPQSYYAGGMTDYGYVDVPRMIGTEIIQPRIVPGAPVMNNREITDYGYVDVPRMIEPEMIQPRIVPGAPVMNKAKKYPKLDQNMYGDEFKGKIKYVVTRDFGEMSSSDESSDSEIDDFESQTIRSKKKTKKTAEAKKSPEVCFETETSYEPFNEDPFGDSDLDENGEYIHFTSEDEESENEGIISKFKKL